MGEMSRRRPWFDEDFGEKSEKSGSYSRCIRKDIHAVDVLADGTLHIMKKEHYLVWKTGQGYITKKRISRKYFGVNGNINAIVTSPATGNKFIFKGSQLW